MHWRKSSRFLLSEWDHTKWSKQNERRNVWKSSKACNEWEETVESLMIEQSTFKHMTRRARSSENRNAVNIEQFSRELFKTAKWARNAIADTLTQATIFSLIKSECFNIVTTAQNKMKMMFQIHFSSSSKILMLNTKDFKYSLSIENDASLMHCKIKKVIYKIMLNKISKHTEYTNKIMCKLVDDALK